jgi:hypothetical protein
MAGTVSAGEGTMAQSFLVGCSGVVGVVVRMAAVGLLRNKSATSNPIWC